MESGVFVHPEVAIKDAATAIDVLNETDFTMLTDDQLAASVIDLHRVASSLEAACTRVVAVTDARHAIEDDGARSIGRWIAWKCRIPHGRAAREAHNGRALRQLPEVETAFTAGEITGEHVRLLADAAELNREAFERDTQMLLGEARRLSHRQFTRALAYWSYVNAPDKTEEAARKRDAGRKVHCSETFGGKFALTGMLPAVGGTIFANELRRLEQELFDADVKEATARLGRKPSASDLARTGEQRRCDALIEMARRSAAWRANRTSARPLFTVLVGYDAFRNICELASGTVVTPGQVAPFLTDADVERVVFDGPSRILDVGVRKRVFTGATRRAVEVRDQTCWHESCDIPAEQCEVDHTQPYEIGGLTIQSNGRCGCKFHHRQRHKHNRPPPE